MPRSILCCVSALALAIAAAPAGHGQQRNDSKRVSQSAAARAPANAAGDDCEARIRKLDASDAEGNERLAEKNDVIELCAKQYRRDKTIDRLVNECAKYEEQAIVKQQTVAECQLAAYNYANALHTLKAWYRK